MPVPAEVSVVCVDPNRLASAPSIPLTAVEPDPDAVAYVIYTSGSTGRPKGVEVPNRALTNSSSSSMHATTPGLASADHLLPVTTISFDIAGLEIFLPAVTGASVADCGARRRWTMDGRRLAEAIESSGATVMRATPGTWRMLLEAKWRGDRAPQAPLRRRADAARPLLATRPARARRFGLEHVRPDEETTDLVDHVHRGGARRGPVLASGGRSRGPYAGLHPRSAMGNLCPTGFPGSSFPPAVAGVVVRLPATPRSHGRALPRPIRSPPATGACTGRGRRRAPPRPDGDASSASMVASTTR